MTIDVRDKLVDAHVHVHSPDIAEVSAGSRDSAGPTCGTRR